MATAVVGVTVPRAPLKKGHLPVAGASRRDPLRARLKVVIAEEASQAESVELGGAPIRMPTTPAIANSGTNAPETSSIGVSGSLGDGKACRHCHETISPRQASCSYCYWRAYGRVLSDGTDGKKRLQPGRRGRKFALFRATHERRVPSQNGPNCLAFLSTGQMPNQGPSSEDGERLQVDRPFLLPALQDTLRGEPGRAAGAVFR